MAFDHIYSGSNSNNVFDAIQEANQQGYSLTDTWWIDGNDGDDTISGANSDDYLIGGAGVDIMAGRLGNDVYYVEDLGDDVVENANEGIDLVKSSLKSYTLAANVENLELTSTLALGKIAYGYGNGLNNLMIGHKTSSHSDRLFGGSGDDTLRGYQGNDLLDGGDENDSLNGGSGNDTMIGGAGDDIFIVDSSGDVVIEAFNEGFDSVYASLSSYELADNVEKLVFQGINTGVNGQGNVLDNVINVETGYTGPSSNTLNGLAGDDTIRGGEVTDYIDGGSGADLMLGRGGNDVYEVDNVLDRILEYVNQGDSDRVISSVSYTLSDHVENLDLTGTAFSGEGNDLDNIIRGTSSYNRLVGNDGNDTLVGQDGDDTLIGGNGDDVLDGAGNGADPLESDGYFGGAGADTFVLGDSSGIGYLGFGNAGIHDFNSLEGDKIMVQGSMSDYQVTNDPLGNTATIYYTGLGYQDAVGWVTNTSNVSLSTDFVFV
ncbi:MAG: calcium-binding protein [Leptolyngbya sp. SIO1D8]|nr:calcium-binding protein [Leptolyngbya sp. SIO1D8]